MASYDFTIIASGIDPAEDRFEDRLFEAGCGDATISVQKGALVLEFGREARNFSQAIFSAIRDVTTAGARIEHVEPDHLVNLSDIANRAGLSRAAASLYAKGERGRDFPAPVARVTTESPLWDWVSVSRWLFRRQRAVERRVVIEAKIVRQINRAIRNEDAHELMAVAKKLAEIKTTAAGGRVAA